MITWNLYPFSCWSGRFPFSLSNKHWLFLVIMSWWTAFFCLQKIAQNNLQSITGGMCHWPNIISKMPDFLKTGIMLLPYNSASSLWSTDYIRVSQRLSFNKLWGNLTCSCLLLMNTALPCSSCRTYNSTIEPEAFYGVYIFPKGENTYCLIPEPLTSL